MPVLQYSYSSGHMDFVYDKLGTQHRTIRLVTIEPGAWKDEIRCSLQTVVFDDKPSYQALSYVWGDLESTRTIYLNNHEIQVTESLWYALRRLRGQSPRTMWIDAICINQKDDEEKSCQVAMMRDIFKECKEAILWLGEDECDISGPDIVPTSPSARRAFELLGILSIDDHLPEIPCFSVTKNAEVTLKDEYRPHLEALRALAKLPWWTRLWIVQEAAVPANATFVYASESCPADVLVASKVVFLKHSTCCDFWWTELFQQQRQTGIAFNAIFDSLIPILSTRGRYQAGIRHDLFLQRHTCCQLQATNPRDLIYALIGILRDHESAKFMVNYSQPTEEVFAQAAFYSMLQNGWKVLLGQRHRAPGIPTWLPDWFVSSAVDNSVWVELRRKMERYKLYSASREHAPFFRLEKDTLLLAKGLKVGTIQDVGPVLNASNFLQTVEQWSKLLGTPNFHPKTPPPIGSLEDAFWRALTCDTSRDVEDISWNPYRRLGVSRDYSAFYEWWTDVRGGFLSHPSSWGSDVWTANCYHRMFLTEECRIGIAPGNACAGDEVHVLVGSNVPFILRRGHVEESYVVGDCYLHGVMDGEAMTDGGEWQARVQWVELH
ncbi:uncharacterized protein K452DRAFT_319554 [Aplosporella prunicola CBS 121167]|uniref:Heterokaryon incompatibility domain-containing protein n=1 Tax=Aplosporella prunicola CBS 121167 TaxID=1176127 RepID=A0A6A6BBB9_9PEZI|nr:uncharacterized protein K452DRAFT_319554 [Aplosporella prunicola CBS 121167]KAF2140653.1 hypothetical protein K452DRAFT_319554 [Aplosporella prunicola CBS 121167]